MALAQRQDIKLSQTQRLEQRLVMTPKLQQAIKLLLMTRLELEQHIEQEMLQNPLIEEAEPSEEQVLSYDGSDSSEEPFGGNSGDNEERVSKADADVAIAGAVDINTEDRPDIDWQEVFEDNINPSERGQWEDISEDDLPKRDVPTQLLLHEYLLSQLHMSSLSDMEYQIGEMIIYNIDDDGRLNVSLDEIAAELNASRMEEEKIPVSEVEGVLSMIQTFEPVGVAARSLRESLLIQMKVLGMENSMEAKVVKDYFEDLAENRLPKIAKELGIEVEELIKVKGSISRFEPKPGREFSEKREADIIVPEVIVEKMDGEYRVIPNDDGMPKLRVSHAYLRMLQSGGNLTADTREWIENCKRTAIDLIKSIDQRRRTIIRVTESIFKIQKDFLEKGMNYLKPLQLKQIADDIEMHESTVSRVTTKKYVQTPRGIFELKFFFSSGLEGEKGEEVASTSVKEFIKEIVDGEDPSSPLSDLKIVQILKSRGVKAARRTVAKYRDELGVPPSSKRRTKW